MDKFPMYTESTRRDLLRGIGLGVSGALLSPILSQITAQAAGDSKRVNRQRVVFMVQSNGMSPEHLRPEGVVKLHKNGPPTNEKLREIALADNKLHAALEPLEPFKNRLALVQHLSGRVGRSDHSANVGALGACPANKGPVSQTIDHAIAAALPGVIPHVAIGLGANPGTIMNYRLSASGPGQECPIICSPELAFKSLFGSVAAGASGKNFDQSANLLEFMADDVKRARNSLRGEEKEKLDGYLAAFESLHKRQLEIAELQPALKANMPHLSNEQLRPVLSTKILESQFEIGAAALIAGVTNTLLLSSGGGGQGFGDFPELGISGLHAIGHGASQNGKSAAECFTDIRRVHTKLIAEFAKKLDSITEGDGTMLDNTLIVYFSDSGEGHHPGLSEWPVVLLGNLGGKLQTNGRYLEFPGYGQKGHRTMANLYCTLLHAVGKPTDNFGTPDVGLKDIDQTGVVAELLA